jgi:cell division protein FtsB
MFKKVRSVDQIIATFDKTLVELQDRVAHDNAEMQAIQEEKNFLEEETRKRLSELATKEKEHTTSKERALRVHDKIKDLIG